MELAVRLRLVDAAEITLAAEQLARTGKLLDGLIRRVRARRASRGKRSACSG